MHDPHPLPDATTVVTRPSDTGETLQPDVSHELPEFATVMRGYDRGQVDDFVTRLQEFVYDAELRASNADRRVTQAQRRMEDLERELTRVAEQAASRPSTAYDELGERIATILRLAAEEAEALRNAAREQAATVLEEARREREQLHAAAERELAELSRRRDGVVAELGRVRDVLTTLGLASPGGQTQAVQPSDIAAALQSAGGDGAERVDGVDGVDGVVVDLADRQAAAH